MRALGALMALLLVACGSSDSGDSGPGSSGSSGQSAAGAAGGGAAGAGSGGAAGAGAGQGGSGQAGSAQAGSAQAGGGQAGGGQAGGGQAGAGQAGGGQGGSGQGGEGGGGMGQGGAGAGGGCAVCDGTGDPGAVGKLGSTKLTEVSGLVASRVRDGVFYVHNDSGDSARVFAIKLDGSVVSEHKINKAKAVDWEDIAAGPCPAGHCLFIGDIGDNDEKRSDVVIYRVSEEALAAGGDVDAESFPVAYPDGPHNAETLLADPATGDVFIVTKVFSGDTQVFRLPSGATPGQKTTLELVGALTFPTKGLNLATGGDVHPCAPRFLLRTYQLVLEYRAPEGGSLLDAFKAEPVKMMPPKESQGETVAYLPGGLGFATISEGEGSSVFVAQCP